jgi:hypothetical protein
MSKHAFKDLDEVKRVLKQYEQTCDGSKAMAGMGALTILASAMIKLTEEIESVKKAQTGKGG